MTRALEGMEKSLERAFFSPDVHVRLFFVMKCLVAQPENPVWIDLFST